MRLRDGAIYIASKAIPSALAFITTMLLSWLLPPQELGLYGLGLATVSLGNNLLFDWITASFLRWYGGHSDDPVFLSTLLLMFAGLCLLSGTLVAAAAFLGLLGSHQRQAYLFLGGIWAYGWFEFMAALQIGRSRPVRYFTMSLLRNGLMLAGSLSLAYLTRSADAVLAASFASMFVAGSLFLGDGSIRLRRCTFDAGLARAYAAYAAPLGATMVLYGMSNSANRLLLGALASTQAVAGYTVGSTLVQNSLGLISTGIGPAAFAAAARAVETGDADAAQIQLARNYTFLLALLAPACIGVILVAPGFVKLLVDPRYRETVNAMTPFLALYAALIGMRAQYVETAFQLGHKTRLGVQVTAVSACLNLGLNVLFIPRWGAVGSAAALTIACAVSLVYAVQLSALAYPLPLPLRETWRVCAATAAMTLTVCVTAAVLHGVAALVMQVIVGIGTYGAALVALDVLDGRRHGMRLLGLAQDQLRRPTPRDAGSWNLDR